MANVTDDLPAVVEAHLVHDTHRKATSLHPGRATPMVDRNIPRWSRSRLASREAGAARIIVGGRGLRPWKLDLALQLGATHVVNTDEDAVVDVVREVTDGEMVDRAIDTSPNVVKPVEDCIASLRSEGTLVLTATKDEAVPGFVGQIIAKALTVRGAYSVSDWAKRQAIRVLSAGTYDLSRLHTHTLPIDELDRAMRILGGEVPGEEAVHITVTPR